MLFIIYSAYLNIFYSRFLFDWFQLPQCLFLFPQPVLYETLSSWCGRLAFLVNLLSLNVLRSAHKTLVFTYWPVSSLIHVIFRICIDPRSSCSSMCIPEVDPCIAPFSRSENFRKTLVLLWFYYFWFLVQTRLIEVYSSFGVPYSRGALSFLCAKSLVSCTGQHVISGFPFCLRVYQAQSPIHAHYH